MISISAASENARTHVDHAVTLDLASRSSFRASQKIARKISLKSLASVDYSRVSLIYEYFGNFDD